MGLVRVDVSHALATVARVLPRASDKKLVVRQLGAAAMQHWKGLAQTGLRSSGRDYVSSLHHKLAGGKATITLEGMMPNMVEQGWPGGDMRNWLLKGKNAKMGKNGMYNTIPFRHGGPGSSGRNVGAPMPSAVHNVAKKLDATLSRPGGGGSLYGDRLHPDVRKMRQSTRNVITTKKEEWHTTSVYMGMIRQEKTYKKSTSSQYTTFRRISAVKKDPRSWYHPGITPRHYARATQQYVEGIAQSIVLNIAKR